MTVVLTPPSPGDTRSAIADWLELQALESSRGRATRATILKVLDFSEDEAAEEPQIDHEDVDEGILEEDRLAVVTAAFEELEYRQDALGSAYPFSVDGKRLMLDRKFELSIATPGQVVYLFCLLASTIREKKLHPVTAFGDAEKKIADAFQICACLAAGGYINGDVASFGFPRATGNGFLPALRETFKRFGVGEVRTSIPDGLPTSLKDGGIDVISWRDHPDGMPGKIYLLGQCASGQNWESKSVIEFVQQLHSSWFTQAPAAHSLPAMFIPFTFHRDMVEERAGVFLTAVKNAYWYKEMRFGIIFDRLRIAYFAQICMRGGEEIRNRVDGVDRFSTVEEWVTQAMQLSGLADVA